MFREFSVVFQTLKDANEPPGISVSFRRKSRGDIFQIFRGILGLKIKGLIENQIEQHQWITRLPSAGGCRPAQGWKSREKYHVNPNPVGFWSLVLNLSLKWLFLRVKWQCVLREVLLWLISRIWTIVTKDYEGVKIGLIHSTFFSINDEWFNFKVNNVSVFSLFLLPTGGEKIYSRRLNCSESLFMVRQDRSKSLAISHFIMQIKTLPLNALSKLFLCFLCVR